MNSPLNIMHIVLSLECGGLEKMAIDLATGLNNAKFSSSICCINKLGELSDDAKKRGIRVFGLAKNPGFDIFTVIKLARIFRKDKISIVHTHNPGAMIYGALAAKIAGVPVIVTTRHGRETKIVNRFIWGMNNIIVSISDDAQKRLLECNQINKNKARVIHNGIRISENAIENKLSENNSIRSSSSDKIIGTVGRLASEKNYFALIDAFIKISNKFDTAKLVFVGDGVLRKELEQYCVKLRIETKVCFLGFRQDVTELLNSMDVFVLSSLTEGISLGLLEAMAAGKPVVATDVGGNPEVVVNGVSGFLVPAKDPDRMAEAIMKLLSNEKLANNMGRESRRVVEDKFSSNRMLSDYENLYLELLERRNIV